MENIKEENKILNKKVKNSYWQFVRGFAILAVILIHCEGNSDLISSTNGFIYLLVRNIINFPVAVFFFISGYMINLSSVKANPRKWLSKRSCRILLPYLFWSIVYFLVAYFQTQKVNSIQYYIVALLMGKAATPFYYVVVLFYYSMFTPLLVDIYKKNRMAFYLLFLLTPGLQIIGYIFQYKEIFDLWRLLKISPIWLLFYLLGLQFRSKQPEVKTSVFPFLAILFLILEIIESYILMKSNNLSTAAFGQYRISGFLYSFVICVIIYKCKDRLVVGKSFFVKLGNISYPIYYVHWLFILLFNRISTRLELPWLVFFLLQFSFALSASVVVVVLLTRLIKNRFIRKILAIE